MLRPVTADPALGSVLASLTAEQVPVFLHMEVGNRRPAVFLKRAAAEERRARQSRIKRYCFRMLEKPGNTRASPRDSPIFLFFESSVAIRHERWFSATEGRAKTPEP